MKKVQDYFSKASDVTGVVPPKYTTPISMGRAILHQEGALAFSKGITVRPAPLSSFLFPVPLSPLVFFPSSFNEFGH